MSRSQERENLIKAIFNCLDTTHKGRLTKGQLRMFANVCGFSGTTAEWATEYVEVCNLYSWDVAAGPNFKDFAMMVDDPEGFGYCSDAELQEVQFQKDLRVLVEQTVNTESQTTYGKPNQSPKSPTKYNNRGYSPSAASRDNSPGSPQSARNAHLQNPQLTRDFTEWATNRWDMLQHMFTVDDQYEFVAKGSIGRKGFSQREFAEAIREKGFKGDGKAAFNMIVLQCGNEAEDKRRGLTTSHIANRGVRNTLFVESISLSQLLRFKARVLAQEDQERPESAVSRFLDHLNTQRGCALRAWRLDIDQRGTGKVAYVDFVNACRRLNVAGQAKRIWTALRPVEQDPTDGQIAPIEQPLVFDELAKKEGENLNEFAEVLWTAMGFDLDKAWAFLDANKQNWLSLDEFAAGAKKLGYEGDAKLLFKGLDTSNLGRVWKTDFAYLQQVTQVAPRKLQKDCGPLADLITWVQRKLGGSKELVKKLGLSGSCREISVGDLAVHLAALGFDGDARAAATRAARTEGGVKISVDTLMKLFSETPETKPVDAVREAKARLAKSSWQQRRQIQGPTRSGWDDSVSNISDGNVNRSKGQRDYFHVHPPNHMVQQPDRTFQPAPRRKGPLKAWEVRQVPIQRPGWDCTVSSFAEGNQDLPGCARKYFSDTATRPVREEMRKKLGNSNSASQLGMSGGNRSQAMGRFYQFLKIRFGSVEESFAKLDVDRSGKLKQRDFLSQVKRAGFQGDATVVFQQLDQSKAGVITIRDFLNCEPNSFAPTPMSARSFSERNLHDNAGFHAEQYH